MLNLECVMCVTTLHILDSTHQCELHTLVELLYIYFFVELSFNSSFKIKLSCSTVDELNHNIYIYIYIYIYTMFFKGENMAPDVVCTINNSHGFVTHVG